MNKGFVILAQNTVEVDYVTCAEILAKSIKRVIPNASVSLITTNEYLGDTFDHVIPLPYGDLEPDSQWKLSNDWQVYEASPYEYTIKLEADMVVPTNIDYWWDVLADRDVVVSSCIRNFKNEISSVTYYRKFITDNNLPDVYNAITYFKKGEKAEQFFALVRDIFTNWEQYKQILQCNVDEKATTDWVYAIACHVMGVEETTLPEFTDMSMVHMKQYINDTLTEDWTDELVHEVLPDCIRINTFVQYHPFHYHCKNFSDILKDAYAS